ncbi:hypothetical protein C8P63_1279 [Melghirimyces profundicolus]|uniref:Uncharacterized protein n=1 Tax=Melghirimyces profundicolus TaxID=1242148 RepID=A0A2T6BC94_9BACL|nr:hypothetical protein [Melghirimyces profundicolus]PTX53689.1 hypothetical protein C8P63_1279 [Melghirimyces profundicolus]
MRLKFYRTRRLRKVALFSFVGTLMVSGFITPHVAQAPEGHEWGLWGKPTGGGNKADMELSKKRIRPDQKESDHPSSDEEKDAVATADHRMPATEHQAHDLKKPDPTPSAAVHTRTTTQQQMSRPKPEEDPASQESDENAEQQNEENPAIPEAQLNENPEGSDENAEEDPDEGSDGSETESGSPSDENESPDPQPSDPANSDDDTENSSEDTDEEGQDSSATLLDGLLEWK